jgi:selenocysteine-specific elongation factor
LSEKAALLVGTAGHVDHGKTALLRALTGIDCDRLPEEKRRGITLDLGFAHLETGEATIGFVDVPGHERYLANALAGLAGVGRLLLVVAADQGVRAQTREHLAVAELLGVPDAVVALTRIDLADADAADLAELEVEELLAGTRFAGAPVLRVSSVTGEGIAELARALARGATPADGAAAADPARLPVDRVFVVRGQGVVATGTVARGTIRSGDSLTLEPGARPVRVRALEVHGRAREGVGPGGRAALLLAGVEAGELARGQQLVGAGGARAVRRLLARVTLLADAPRALEGSVEVRFHLLAAETTARLRPLAPARIEPGASGLVELRLATPVAAARGDRFVVRRPSPAATLGGGEILDPRWRRPRGGELAPRLAALAGGDADALALWLADARDAGAGAAELGTRLGAAPERIEPMLAALAAAGRALSGAGRWFAPAPLAALERRAAALLDEHFAAEPGSEGMPRAELVRRLLSRRGVPIADFHLDWLARRGVIEARGERVTRPGRGGAPDATESGLARSIVEVYDAAGLEPPSPAEVARRLSASPPMVEGLVRHLVKRERLLRLSSGLIVSAAAVERLRRDVEATGWERFDVGRFKERFALSRKFAIPLLERLDAIGATRRDGDQRIVVRRRPATPPA